jgi:hypothetical protein
LRLICQGTLRGRPCRNTLIDIEGAEFRVKHRGRQIVLRGVVVSGSVQCEDCGTVRYLLPSDLGLPEENDLREAA